MIDATNASDVTGVNGGQDGGVPPPASLSLPLREDHERKRLLGLERRKEYNEFLNRKQADEEEKRLSRKKHARRTTSYQPVFHKAPIANEPRAQAGRNGHRPKNTSKDAQEKADGGAVPSPVGESSNDSAERDSRGNEQERFRSPQDTPESDSVHVRQGRTGSHDNGELTPVTILREETGKLRKEREEFAKLVSNLREVVSEVRKPSTRAALRAAGTCRSTAQSPSRDEAGLEEKDVADHDWERSQSLDRGKRGPGPTKLEAISLPNGLEKPHDAKTRTYSKEDYLRDLEAQINENRERRRREREEEAMLDRKCIEEYHDPWGRDLAVVMTGHKRRRFLGDVVRPVETSSDIMPSKARSESNLYGEPRRRSDAQATELISIPVGPRLNRKLCRGTLPPNLYGKELQKQQIEDKKKREEEQKLKDAAEEEKLNKRVEEQRLRMYQEYQDERKRTKSKDLQLSRRQERVQKTHHPGKEKAAPDPKKPAPHLKGQKPISIIRPQDDSRKKKNESTTDFRPPRRRSESRDRMANNLEILRRQLATEQQISRIQQMQKNYVVGEGRRFEGLDF